MTTKNLGQSPTRGRPVQEVQLGRHIYGQLEIQFVATSRVPTPEHICIIPIFAEITGDRPRQSAYEIKVKLMLSRVSWSLSRIYCYLK